MVDSLLLFQLNLRKRGSSLHFFLVASGMLVFISQVSFQRRFYQKDWFYFYPQLQYSSSNYIGLVSTIRINLKGGPMYKSDIVSESFVCMPVCIYTLHSFYLQKILQSFIFSRIIEIYKKYSKFHGLFLRRTQFFMYYHWIMKV